jgi:hypothetical protein
MRDPSWIAGISQFTLLIPWRMHSAYLLLPALVAGSWLSQPDMMQENSTLISMRKDLQSSVSRLSTKVARARPHPFCWKTFHHRLLANTRTNFLTSPPPKKYKKRRMFETCPAKSLAARSLVRHTLSGGNGEPSFRCGIEQKSGTRTFKSGACSCDSDKSYTLMSLSGPEETVTQVVAFSVLELATSLNLPCCTPHCVFAAELIRVYPFWLCSDLLPSRRGRGPKGIVWRL